MPRNKKQLREFCCTCKSRIKKYMNIEHRWKAKVSKKHPYSVCRVCNKERKAVDVNDEKMVGVGFFCCDCGHEYTVICRRIDTAVCYKYTSWCSEENYPYKVYLRRRIKRQTDNEHSCSRCDDGEIYPCPNMSGFGDYDCSDYGDFSDDH